MKMTKNRKKAIADLDRMKEYSLEDAVKMVKELKFTKFDESVDLAMNLGVDPRHADQNIRVSTSLPHGTGKEVKVLVVTQGPKEKEAEDAGADFVGKSYLEKIKGGWDDVDKIIATPDMMPVIGKIGKILGPKGLMPNPKLGTVTQDVATAVKNAKSGQIKYKNDKAGIVHAGIGKLNFKEEDLLENLKAFYESIHRSKPDTVKGSFIKKVTIASTMGFGLKINAEDLRS